jgi:hypothetical protein
MSGGKRVDVNHWLVEQGYAYPTFYTTMANDEINMILAAMAKGRKLKGRLWARYENDTSDFNPKVVFRGKGGGAAAGSGKVNDTKAVSSSVSLLLAARS